MRSKLLTLLQALVIGVVIAVAATLAIATFGFGAWLVIGWVRKRFGSHGRAVAS